MSDDEARGGEATRAALVAAATHLFGHNGFEGTSTRAISARASTNIAAIAYHFGGKDGLRIACGEAIAGRLGAVLGGLDGGTPSPEEATRRLEGTARAMLRFLALEPRAEDMVAFMLREITEGGPVLDPIYAALIEPRHRALCRLWAAASGQEPESEATRLAVFAMIGQILYFRIGQPIILRRMGWERMDAAAAESIADLLVRNLRAALAAARERGAP
jgi:TetR/AcrR family transcriptional regulator, regulator of cefoperazone and chloramphenicol sensitivity